MSYTPVMHSTIIKRAVQSWLLMHGHLKTKVQIRMKQSCVVLTIEPFGAGPDESCSLLKAIEHLRPEGFEFSILYEAIKKGGKQ